MSFRPTAFRARLRPARAGDAARIADLYLASRKIFLPYAPLAHGDDEVRDWMRSILVPAGQHRRCGATSAGRWPSSARAAPAARPATCRHSASAPATFSLLAPAYAKKYGVAEDELKQVLARIAWKNHRNGAKNPKAQFRKDEMWLQLRGAAGPRQIANPRLGLTHNLGGQPGRCVSFVSVVGA
jgi:hypothetical protein